MKLDRLTAILGVIVAVVVFGGAWGFQRSVQNSADLRVVAQQRVNATLDNCHAQNATRDHQIQTSEVAIKAAAEAPPTFITPEGRLLLTKFVRDTNRKLEQVAPPKTCTVKSLHLEALTAIAHP